MTAQAADIHFLLLKVLIGDGSYVFTLEKRGYVKSQVFTPEAAVEEPGAVRQLGEEFARAGADLTQVDKTPAERTNICRSIFRHSPSMPGTAGRICRCGRSTARPAGWRRAWQMRRARSWWEVRFRYSLYSSVR